MPDHTVTTLPTARSRPEQLLDAALSYGRHGAAVFPCRGKEPAKSKKRGGHGCHDATTDPNVILQLWREFPGANIGIATGKPSGFWVLDVDGPAGEKSLAALEAQHGKLPDTLTGRTGGGGRHLLFRHHGESIKNRAKDIGDGLDVRATGGYIIAPPSCHPETGAFYEWDGAQDPALTAIADAPAWLIELVCGQNRRRREQSQDRVRRTMEGVALPPGMPGYAEKALEEECRIVAQTATGSRNDRLNTAAFNLGQLVGGGVLDLALAERRLYAAADSCGLIAEDGENSVMATINSGLTAGIAQPRTVPEPQAKAFRNGQARPIPSGARSEGSAGQQTHDKADAPPDEVPVIRVQPGELPRMVDEAEEVLVAAKAPVYQRGSMLVAVGESVIKTRHGEIKGPRLVPASVPLLVEQLTLRAVFEKYDARSEGWKPTDCPTKIAETYLARGRWKLRPLMGIIEAPTLRWDGSILDKQGYDDGTGLILMPGGPRPTIPERPTREQAAAALRILAEPLREFPFVTAADRAVALSGILTAVSRRAYPSAPLHAFSAPVAGTGKGKLVDIAAMIVSGRPAPVIAPGKKEEETEKRLGAVLIAGDPILSIDNVEHPLGGELLCQMLTQPSLKVRILGTSDLLEVPPNMALFATGNNLEIAGDMTRRTLLCQLDPECERPEMRQFAFDPVAMVARDRPRYIGAALTVLRAYVVAGRPDAPTRLGSFEDWSDTVRGALLWLGEADPVETINTARESDPVLTDLRTLMTAWADRIGHYERLSAAKLIERANQVGIKGDYANPALREALMSLAGDGRTISSKRLGRWLKTHSRRIVNGLRIVLVEDDKSHGAVYRLDKA